jgi:DNA primase
MAKLAQNFAKYLVNAKLNANGIVERPDIIGAIFGQTEGLLGAELDLRELQRTGRIGRIEVNVKNSRGKSFAEINIPSSLDAAETSLIAASLETIEKVGPCDSEIEVTKVEDVRSQQRRYVVERAKDILYKMSGGDYSDSARLSEMVKESVRTREVQTYQGLSCGPDIKISDEIIIVEGRADVINLLKNGIRNCIAIEGSKIPEAVRNLTKEKVVTAFLDGDRGGDLDLKKLLAVAEIDFVARAEEGKEVEELTKKQIYKAIREKIPVNQEKLGKMPEIIEQQQEEPIIDDKTKSTLGGLLNDLTGTRAAYIVSDDMEILSKVPLSELSNILDEYGSAHAIVFDGKINQLIVDMAIQRKVGYLVGTDYKEKVSHGSLKILTKKDFQNVQDSNEREKKAVWKVKAA